MSTAPTIPMIAPDGSIGDIPASQVGAAAAKGFQIGKEVELEGTKGVIPFSRYGEFMKQHGPITGPQEAPASPQQDLSLSSGPMRHLKAMGQVFADTGSGLYHSFTDAPRDAEEARINGSTPQSGVVSRALGQFGLGAYRNLVAPQINEAREAITGATSPDMRTRLESGAHALAAAIPGLGPAAVGVGKTMQPQIEQGNYQGALGTLEGNALMGMLMDRATTRIPDAPVRGQNYTQEHAQAFEGATAQATAMGRNFIPQNLTPEALSAIRQSATDMTAAGGMDSSIAKAATGAKTKPLDRLGAYQAVAQRGLSNIESEHQSGLQSAAHLPVDTQDLVADLQGRIIPGMSAEDAAAIRDYAQRAGQIKTIGDLNGFRSLLNTETAPQYRQTAMQAGRSAISSDTAASLADAVREKYYNELGTATGTDYAPLKRKESALMTTLEALQNLNSPQAVAEARFKAPSTLRERIGELANVIKEPKTVVTQTILRESPATRLSNMLRQSLADLPESGAGVVPQQIAQPSTSIQRMNVARPRSSAARALLEVQRQLGNGK